jgi:hypothetical protein
VLETGQAILIDLLTNRAGTFVVSRLPLRDESSGELIGAIGIVLFDHPETTLQPLISKFAHLQRDLDDARRELASQRRTKYTLGSFIGGSAAAVEVKRPARCCCWAKPAPARNCSRTRSMQRPHARPDRS